MSTPTKRRRAGWWVAGLTVVFAGLGFALLFRPLGQRGNTTSPVAAATAAVNITRLDEGMGDRFLREQATLFDPTPLFLPTTWNTNQQPLPAAVQRQPGQVFRTFAPKLMYDEAELALPVGSMSSLPKRPADLLKEPSHDPFLGFDREDVPLSSPAPRQGFIEVRETGSGEMVLACQLDGPVALPAGRDWQPAEFLVAVTAAGLLGRPVDTASSDVEEVDAFFRDYLAKTLHLGERLPPGIYRVVVGP
ncbi:MAG: hypothetical protein PHE83_08500 [Opitutaceae bacterium]|nr:hypothetical protein [Opitutaceae bacterium]